MERIIRLKGILVSLFLLLTSGIASAQTYLPLNFTIEGRLFDNGSPAAPINDIVDIQLELIDPAAPTCVIYREVHDSVDVQSGDSSLVGRFAVRMGSGSTVNFGGANNLVNAFGGKAVTGDNSTTPFDNVADALCARTPAAGTNFQVRISIKQDSAVNFNPPLSPNTVITAIPQALAAETLQGKTPNEFLQVNTTGFVLSQANLQTIFTGANYTELTALLGGTSTQYLQEGGGTITGPINMSGQQITNVAAPTAGTDAVNRTWVDGHIGDKAADLSGVGSGVNGGHTLIWDAAGNRWITGVPSATDNTKLPLTGGTMSGAITMSGFDIYNAGHITMGAQRLLMLGTYTTAQEGGLTLGAGDEGRMFYNSTTKLVKVWDGTGYSGFMPAGAAGGDLAGSSYPNPTISNSAVTTAKITDDAVTAAKIGVNAVQSEHVHQAGIGMNRILMSDGTTGNTLQFKTCALNEILQWTATGWTCVPGGAILPASGVTAGTYGNATSVGQFMVNAQGVVTAATDIAINFPVTSVNGLSGAVTLNGSHLGLGTASLEDAGNAAGELPILDAGGKLATSTIPDLPSVDGSALTNVNAATIRGVNVSTTAPISQSQFLGYNGSAWVAKEPNYNDLVNGAGVWFTYRPSNVACATNEVLKWNGSAWHCGTDNSGGSAVTLVQAGSGLTGGTITGTGTLSVDVGTTTGQIVQVAAGNKLPAIDGSDVPNIANLRNVNVSTTAPTLNQVLQYNGSAWEAASLTDNAGVTFIATTTDLTGGPITGTGTIGINVGSGPNQIVKLDSSSQLPAVDGSQLTNVDAQSIDGQTVSASAPSGGQVLKYTGTQWEPATDANSGGTVTLITAGTGLVPNSISTTGTLHVNAGTAANQIVQLNGSAQLPAVNGSLLTNINAVKLQTYDVHTAAPADNQVLTWNNSASYWEPRTAPAGATNIDELSDARYDGSGNLGLGLNTLAAPTGNNNIAMGTNALQDVTTGNQNIGIGNNAATNVTSGTGNIGIGKSTLQSVTNQSGNTAIGYNAGFSSTGTDNSLFGSSVWSAGTGSGSYNSVFGAGSFGLNTSGSSNTVVGQGAATNNSAGSNNTILGAGAGTNLTTGSYNVVIGYGVNVPNPTGSTQLTIGNLIYGTGMGGTGANVSYGRVGVATPNPQAALDVVGSGTNSALIVPRDSLAGRPTGVNGMIRYNTNTSRFEAYENDQWVNMIGAAGGTGDFLRDGSLAMTGNLRLGGQWLSDDGGPEGIRVLSTGQVGVGVVPDVDAAFQVGGTGQIILPIGTTAQRASTSEPGMLRYNSDFQHLEAHVQGDWHNLISGYSFSSTNSLFVGAGIGGNNSGIDNTAIGYFAGRFNTSGAGNTSIGRSALEANTTGNFNTALGTYALKSSTADQNVALGYDALSEGVGPSDTVAIGVSAGKWSPGTANIFIGHEAGLGTTGGDGNIIIGAYKDLPISTGSNQLNIGNLIYGVGLNGSGNIVSQGRVAIGTQNPIAGAVLELYGTGQNFSSLIVPRASTAERPIGQNGMIRYNTSLAKFEVYENGNWANVVSAAGAGGDFMASGTVPMTGNIRLNGNWLSGDGGNEGVFVNASGHVGVGTTLPQGELHTLSTSTANAFRGVNTEQVSASTHGASFSTFKARGTPAAKTVVNSGDFIGGLVGFGWTGSTYETGAQINFLARVGYTPSTRDTAILFQTTQGNTVSERMRIEANGNVGIGTTIPTSALHLKSSTNSSYGVLIENQSVSASAFASLATVNDNGSVFDMGIGSTGTSAIYQNRAYLMSTAGAQGVSVIADAGDIRMLTGSNVERLRIDNQGRVGIGTTNPNTSAILDVNGVGPLSAMLLPRGNNTERGSITGAPGMIRYNTDASTIEFYNGSTWTAFGTGNFLSDGSVGMTGQFKAANGTAGTPSYSFVNDPNTGFFFDGTADTIQVSTGGGLRFAIDTTGLMSPNTGGARVMSATGVAASPTYSFAGDSNTGFYRSGTAKVSLSTGGTPRFTFDSMGLSIGNGITSATTGLDVLSNGYFHHNSAPMVEIKGFGGDSSVPRLRLTKSSGVDPTNTFPANPGTVLGSVEFLNHSGTGGATVTARTTQAHTTIASGTQLELQTTPDGSNARQTRMTIASNGNVGIGTSTPNSLLEVVGSTTATVGTIEGAGVDYTFNPAGTSSAVVTGHDVSVYTTGSATMGTANMTANSAFAIHSGTNTLGNAQGSVARVENVSGTINTAIGLSSSVNKGSGTISNAKGLSIAQVQGTNATGIEIGDIQGTSSSYAIYQASNNDINFFAGNVGIGTMNPAFALEVNGITAFNSLKGRGTSPPCLVGPGVGGTVSCTVSGTPTAHTVTVNSSGSNGTPGNSIVRVDFTTPFSTAPHCVFSPANSAAATLFSTAAVYMDNVDGSSYHIRKAGAGNTGGVTYVWTVHCIE